MIVKSVGSNGQITLGKEFAGRLVMLDQTEPGVWTMKLGQFIAARSARTNAFGVAHPPRVFRGCLVVMPPGWRKYQIATVDSHGTYAITSRPPINAAMYGQIAPITSSGGASPIRHAT